MCFDLPIKQLNSTNTSTAIIGTHIFSFVIFGLCCLSFFNFTFLLAVLFTTTRFQIVFILFLGKIYRNYKLWTFTLLVFFSTCWFFFFFSFFYYYYYLTVIAVNLSHFCSNGFCFTEVRLRAKKSTEQEPCLITKNFMSKIRHTRFYSFNGRVTAVHTTQRDILTMKSVSSAEMFFC